MADRSKKRHNMVLRTSTWEKTRTVTWTTLPQEIRLMILEEVARQKLPGWSSLASVNREWQFILERLNFNRLKLSSSKTCLEKFQRLVIRQREHVRHIWFTIELPKYKCSTCTKHSFVYSTSGPIRNGIRRLFGILSTWEPAGSLTLELNVHSPSDSQHWFKNYHFSSEATSTGPQESDYSWHDPNHYWEQGKQVLPPPASAIHRLFQGTHVDMEKLPRVDSVTSFTIRRQLRRRLSPMALVNLLGSFTRVEHLTYEPWRHWNTDSTKRHSQGK